MKSQSSERYPEITRQRIRQIPKFQNISPEFAEQMAETIKKLCAILYSGVEREMNEKKNKLPS